MATTTAARQKHDDDDDDAPVIDPVCGMKVDPTTAKYRHRHGGDEYLFCSDHCRTKFAKDPRHYLDGHHREAAAVAEPGTLYTCPMHPEIVRDAPDDCPICGMALEPMGVPAADEGPNPELVDFRRRFRVGAVLTVPLLVLTMAPMVGLGFIRDMLGEGTVAMDRARPEHAGHSLGRLAVLRSRREVGDQPQPQYVHADRHGRGRGLSVQRRRRARAWHLSGGFSQRRGTCRRLFRGGCGDRGAGAARPAPGAARA